MSESLLGACPKFLPNTCGPEGASAQLVSESARAVSLWLACCIYSSYFTSVISLLGISTFCGPLYLLRSL